MGKQSPTSLPWWTHPIIAIAMVMCAVIAGLLLMDLLTNHEPPDSITCDKGEILVVPRDGDVVAIPRGGETLTEVNAYCWTPEGP